jgi:hypothetical protein
MYAINQAHVLALKRTEFECGRAIAHLPIDAVKRLELIKGERGMFSYFPGEQFVLHASYMMRRGRMHKCISIIKTTILTTNRRSNTATDATTGS